MRAMSGTDLSMPSTGRPPSTMPAEASPSGLGPDPSSPSGSGVADELPLAGHVDDHALALQDLQGAGGHPVRDVVMFGDRVDRGDPAGHGPLGDLVLHHLGNLLIRRYRRVRVDHMGQHSR